MPDAASERRSVVSLAIAIEGGLVVLAVFLGWLLDQPPFEQYRWDASDAAVGLAATVPMLLLFFAMLRWPVGPLRAIKKFSEEVLRPLLAPCTVIDLLGISTLAGIGEEMLFRGVLQGSLAGRLGPWPALAIASLFFGLMHAITATYAVLAALLGVYLGWIYLLCDNNLLAATVPHVLYDFVALLYLLRGPGSAAGAATEEEVETGTKNAS
jgi:membrane protease YdiL (CAAX protease family)